LFAEAFNRLLQQNLPKTDVKLFDHLVGADNGVGTVIPIALAVFKLMISAVLVDS
jgi:hypothetical protein